MNDDITSLVYQAFKEVLDLQAVDFEKPHSIDENTLIYGSNGYLDSLGIASLVIAIEEKVREKFNISISLATEKAMSRTATPFKDIKSLSMYLKDLLKERLSNAS